MPVWRTPYYPQVGDYGQVLEWDAEVIAVHPSDHRVTVEIYDDEQGDRFVEMPFISET